VSKLIDAMKVDKNAAVTSFNRRRINLSETDLPSISRGHLIELRSQMKAALPATTDRLSKFHLQDLIARIDQALKPTN
jgi:hypothetical protein